MIEWNAFAVSYTLSSYDAGLSIPTIHANLVKNSYNIQQYTIEQCLRVNGRNIDIEDLPQQPRGISWNDLADKFVLSAIAIGLDVFQIHAQMTAQGYDVNTAEIASALIAIGVQGIRITNYLI